MLLDQRLCESGGDAIVARLLNVVWEFRRGRIVVALLFCLLSLSAARPNTSHAQEDGEAIRLIASLKSGWPDLYARLIGLERAHSVFYRALVNQRGKVKEADVFRLMTERIADGASGSPPDAEADAGYAALGPRAAAIIRRTHVFHREVLSIFANLEASERNAALDAAVDRYLSRPDVALPDVPKDMTILYDHPYTSFIEDEFKPRRELKYPKLTGFVWASHWFQLAVQEPLEAHTNSAERLQGLKVVTERFQRKLSSGQPPDGFPLELPLSPSIAPGLVSVHERAAAIIDNLNMMNEVLAEVLVHPKVVNRHAAIGEVVEQFTDRRYRVVEPGDWITMALRHSIFAQGGPALGVMTQSDRNSSGHFQHSRRRSFMPPGEMQ